MDKSSILRALLASPFITGLDEEITMRISVLNLHNSAEPALIFCQSHAVGWIRIDGDNAIWRYGNMLTGESSLSRSLGHPLQDGGRVVARAFEEAWEELNPDWSPPPPKGREPEYFAARIENGQFNSMPPRPAPNVVSAAPKSQPSLPLPGAPTDSPYETEFNPYRHDRTRYPAAPGFRDQQLDGRILETVQPAVAPAVIGGVALFVAVLPMPYEFYVLLRWIVPAMAIWMCTIANGHKRTSWVIVFALIAILWNPLIPVEMPRGFWALPDLIGAALFAVAGVGLKASKPALRTGSSSSS